VAASYLWNINHPTSETNLGYADRTRDGRTNGLQRRVLPAAPGPQQLRAGQWFEVERPIDEENRAGFRLDTVYGKTVRSAQRRWPTTGTRTATTRRSTSPGLRAVPRTDRRRLTFKASKFATPFGYEVAGTV
jgi:hypothetical protein